MNPSQTVPLEAFDRIGPYYDDLVERYGHDPRACDYGRPESQASKFRVLQDVLIDSDRSVLDVGCGFADFADYLHFHGVAIDYHGIDLSHRMVREAKARHPELDLRQMNLLEMPSEREYDVVVANGIFYLLGQQAADLMPRMIERMMQLARRAVAVNSLSQWADDRQAGEFYADPLQTVATCRSMTPRITLRHDYHPRDFTLYLYKC